MATCPQCGKIYGDEMRFCLDDGALLSAAAPSGFDAPTEEFSVGDTRAAGMGETGTHSVQTLSSSRQQKRSGMLPLVVGALVVIVGLGLIGLAAAGGVWYFVNTGNDDEGNKIGSLGETPTPLPFDVETPRPTPMGHYPTPTPPPAATRNPKDDDPANKVATPDRIATPRPSEDGPANATIQPTDEKPARVPKVVSGGVLNGRATSLPKPPYPAAARAVRASGSVIVQVTVNELGEVISASAVSGHPLLRAAAAQAARGARFRPMILSGQPVKVTGVITYNFVP